MKAVKRQKSAAGNHLHLQRDVLSEGDVSWHSEVVELQHVRDAFKPGQKLLNLQNKRRRHKDFLIVWFLKIGLRSFQ